MSDFDKSKNDFRALDNEESPNEGELSENELNKVSGGSVRNRNADLNDKRSADKASRNSSDNFSDFNSSDTVAQ